MRKSACYISPRRNDSQLLLVSSDSEIFHTHGRNKSAMKKTYLLLLLLAPVILAAQGNKIPVKLFVGLNFSPDYSYRTLKSDGSTGAELVSRFRNDQEIAKPGYTTGITLLLALSPKIILESGLQLSGKGYKTKEMELAYFPPNPAAPVAATGNFRFRYLGIPLRAKFAFGRPNFRLMPGIGCMINFLTSSTHKYRYTYSDGHKEEREESFNTEYRKTDFSPMISLGTDIRLNSRFHILAEPTYRWGMVSPKDSPITEKLWSAGLNVGLFYTLR
jgi:Outer membrane protein beta-barrel domain